jgi:hypothetical protein
MLQPENKDLLITREVAANLQPQVAAARRKKAAALRVGREKIDRRRLPGSEFNLKLMASSCHFANSFAL